MHATLYTHFILEYSYCTTVSENHWPIPLMFQKDPSVSFTRWILQPTFPSSVGTEYLYFNFVTICLKMKSGGNPIWHCFNFGAVCLISEGLELHQYNMPA